MVPASNGQVILNDWRAFSIFAMTVEAMAVAVNVWSLWRKWNAPWWVFGAQAFSLAAICAAATLTGVVIWRARNNPYLKGNR